MDIEGTRVLVLGGYGLVGTAVCRELIAHRPADLVIASLREGQAQAAVAQLRDEFEDSETNFLPAWGDILLRAEWQDGETGGHPRDAVLADPELRRQLVADILEELDEEILDSSLLGQLIDGRFPGLDDRPADIVIDCVNTATAVAYQNVFQAAKRLEGRIEEGMATDWPQEVERLLTSLYVPQLVRHVQVLFEAMVRAGTSAYVKVGTSGTGGMGFNIPYTHGEERPSRVLLSKSAVAGAQTMLIFLMARTPGGPTVVKEIKPTAAIAWKEIDYGTIRGGGQVFSLYDCPPENAYRLTDPGVKNLEGEFGAATGGHLESVYIDTGENGLFAVGEFTALTSLGQMAFVTPEEIAQCVVAEIRGASTGRDVVGALDGAVTGPSYRAGFLREAALNRLHQLEEKHGIESVAFEMLGPPRLSKLLFEAYLIKRVAADLPQAIEMDAERLAASLQSVVEDDARVRQHILSIGLPILLADGERILRGPRIKSQDAEHGWVDLRPSNVVRWQGRLRDLQSEIGEGLSGDSSSQVDRSYPGLRRWRQAGVFDVGEVVGWLFSTEEGGRRTKP